MRIQSFRFGGAILRLQHYAILSGSVWAMQDHSFQIYAYSIGFLVLVLYSPFYFEN